ncbi:MAG: hypothetical protein ACHQPI_03690 [Thermoanaerobaculia bacterium]
MTATSTPSDGFLGDPRRSAVHVLRGFRYQLTTTVLRWLALPEGHLLYLEKGEDIDLVLPHTAGDSEPPRRFVEQLKLKARISLRSPASISAIAHLWEHRRRNPGITVNYRFTTTASPVTERGVSFPSGLTGIEAWERARLGRLEPQDISAFLASLRALLRTAPRPDGVSADLDSDFREWLPSATDHELLHLVEGLEWSTRAPVPADQDEALCRELQLSKVASNSSEARELSAFLVGWLLDLLSKPGDHCLTRSGLAEELADKETLATHRSRLDRLDGLLLQIQADVDRTSQRLSALEGKLETLTKQVAPGGPSLLSQVLPPPDAPPELPRFTIHRAALEDAITKTLSTSPRWFWLWAPSGYGKTTLATAITLEQDVVWIRLPSDEPAPLLLRRLEGHLLRLASEADVSVIAAYRAGDISIDALAAAAVNALPPRSSLIIDNLPAVTSQSAFGDVLIRLNRFARERLVHLITTSQYPAPTQYVVQEALQECPVPAFSQEEIADLLRAAAAPSHLDLKHLSALLLGFTRGHPFLCEVRILTLVAHDWRFDTGSFADFVTGPPGVQAEAIRRATDTTTSDERTLLYRLSLAEQPFSAGLAERLASIPPPVGRSAELLIRLRGPWISRRPDGAYELVQVLAGAGRTLLKTAEQQATDLEIAAEYLSRKEVSPYEALYLCIHLLAAKAWDRLAIFLIQIAWDLSKPAVAGAFDSFASLEPGKHWPDDLPVRTESCILAAKSRILNALGRDSAPTLARLDLITRSATPMEVYVPLLLAGPLDPHLSPGTRAQRTVVVARLFTELPDDFRILPAGMPIESLIWLGIGDVRSSDDVLGVLQSLGTMTPEMRERALADAEAMDVKATLLDELWRLEAEKPEGDRDWQGVLKVLDYADEISQLPGAQGLIPFAVRARAITLGSHLGRLEDAVTLIDSALTSGDLNGGFLLRYTVATLFSDAREFARVLPYLAPALTNPPNVSPVYVTLAREVAIEAAGRIGRNTEARRYAVEGLVDDSNPLSETHRLEFLGELALARWAEGERRRAVGALAALTLGIGSLPPGPVAAELTVKVGRATAQLLQTVMTFTFKIEKVTSEVLTGLFVTRNAALADLFSSKSLSSAKAMLAMLAANVGLTSLGQRLMNGLAEGPPDATPTSLIALAMSELSRCMVRQGRHVSALVVQLRSASLMDRILDGESERPRPTRETSEKSAIALVVVPAILEALATEPTISSARRQLDELERGYAANATLSSIPTFWEDTFSELKQAFSEIATKETIRSQVARQGTGGDLMFRSLLAIAVGFQGDMPVPTAAGYQAVAFDTVRKNDAFVPGILKALSRFLNRFWLAREGALSQQIQLQGLSPKLASHLLKDESPTGVARLLLISSAAVSLPNETLVELRRLAGS